MKKNVYRVLILLISLFIGVIPGKVQAAGGGPQIEFTKSASSTTADNSSKITFSILTFYYKCQSSYNPDGTCSDGSPYYKAGSKNNEFSIKVSGSGNALGGSYTGSNGEPTIKTGDDGKASFTLASSVAESKTVTIYYTELNDPNHAQNPKLDVSFSAPAPKKTVTTAPAPAPVEVKTPDAPTASAIETDGVAVGDNKTISVQADESLTLKGVTVPNGVVKLYIFSTPREASVTADAQGNWSYAISGLEAGSHHVEAEVTDPSTGKTSQRATLAEFTVKAPTVVAATTKQTKQKDTPWLVIGGLVITLLAGAGVGGWWLWKRKKQAKLPSSPVNPDDASSDSTQDHQI